MKLHIALAVAVSASVTAGAVLADSQLARSAGLTAEQAQGMTLAEIAAAKHNRGLSAQDQELVFKQQTPGSNPELERFAIEKYNVGRPYSDRILYKGPEETTSMAFQDTIDVDRHHQLIAAARLTPEDAAGMNLQQVQVLYLKRMDWDD